MLLNWNKGLNAAWTVLPNTRSIHCTWNILRLKAADQPLPGQGLLYPEQVQVWWGYVENETWGEPEHQWTLDIPYPMPKPKVLLYVLEDAELKLLTPFERLSLSLSGDAEVEYVR